MKIMLLSTVVVLAACSHGRSNVRDAGNGMHSITASASWGGYTGSREEAIAEASEFCGRSGQKVSIDSFADQPGAAAGGTQTSTMVFSCAARAALQYR